MEVVQDPTTFLVVGGAGVLIPLAVAFLTKIRATGVVQAGVAVALTALTAVGAALGDVGNIASDWKQVVGAGALALLAAGASHASVWKDTLEARIHEWSDRVGVG